MNYLDYTKIPKGQWGLITSLQNGYQKAKQVVANSAAKAKQAVTNGAAKVKQTVTTTGDKVGEAWNHATDKTKQVLANANNKAGEFYHNTVKKVLDTPLTITPVDDTGRPFVNMSNEEAPKPVTYNSTVGKQLGQAGLGVAAMTGSLTAFPAVAAMSPTAFGASMVGGAVGSHYGSKLGDGVSNLLGVDEKAREMNHDLFGFTGGVLGGALGAKAGQSAESAINAANKISRSEEFYTGVPKQNKRGEQTVPFDQFDGQVWATKSKPYATQMSKGKPVKHAYITEEPNGNMVRVPEVYDPTIQGQVHKVVVDPKEIKIASLPEDPNIRTSAGPGAYIVDDSGNLLANVDPQATYRSKVITSNGSKAAVPIADTSSTPSQIRTVSQDGAAQLEFQRGADAVKMHLVDGDWARTGYDVQHITLKPGTKRYNLAENQSKWNLFPSLYSEGSANAGNMGALPYAAGATTSAAKRSGNTLMLQHK